MRESSDRRARWTSVLGSIVLVGLSPLAAIAVDFTVDSTGDGSDASPGDGACSALSSGSCTLRAAVQEANALAGHDTITVPESDCQAMGSMLACSGRLEMKVSRFLDISRADAVVRPVE